MAEDLHRVELTDSFLARLETIEASLNEADAGAAFDDLLNQLRSAVIPNLARFRRVGPRYLDHPPQSAEALTLLTTMPTGTADSLREYLHGDYLMLYTVADELATVYLLTIRHHRQLSFDFAGLWPMGS